MQDKLELLLKQINLKEDLEYFKEGSLDKIICNRNKDRYAFCISIQNPLKIETYLIFNKLLKKKYNNAHVSSIFKIKKYNLENIKEYYKYFIEDFSKEAPLLKEFIDSEIKLEDDRLIVEITNKAEEMKFSSIQKNLEDKLNKAGFKIKIETDINEEKAQAIRDEIEKTKVIKNIKVEESPIIMGDEILDEERPINNIIYEENNITVKAKIFGIDTFESSKSNFKIITLKLTDKTDSMYCKIFTKDSKEYAGYLKKLKKGSWYLIKGNAKIDKFSDNELVLNANHINKIDVDEVSREDNAEEKRVELHCHTKMSQMDGVAGEEELVKTAMAFGHKAIAITDHNGCQAFPHVFNLVTGYNKGKEEKDKFKAIYGTELTLIDDSVDIVLRPKEEDLLTSTYVVFDLETTGFNAGGADSIIEIGAVKICNGEIIDRFDELIDPNRPLPAKITELTNITDQMLKGKPNEEESVKKFKEWVGELPMVAHNAKFDVSFIVMAHTKYNLGEFTNTVIDTLELSRALDTGYARHSLSALVKRYDVPWDESAHHRGDYDAEGTALVFHKMVKKLVSRNFKNITDLDKLVSKDEIHKYGSAYHVNIIAKNKTGLKNMFKLISLANTKYLYKTPRILRSEIESHREGLLIGSGCYESEIFRLAKSKSEEELSNLIAFYDYVEVQPPAVYDHLIQMGDFGNKAELIQHLKKIIRVTKESGKIIVATGDVHQINPEDRIYREIIVNQKVPGGGRHPLARKGITRIPSQYLRTTDEMLEDFSFLSEKEAKEIVITNTDKIADMVEILEVIIDTGGIPFAPHIENCTETTLDLVYTKADEIYGTPLPYNIEERLATELYGDEPFNAIKNEISKEGLTEEEYNEKIFKRLHEVMIGGLDKVKEVIKNDIIRNEGETEDIEKKVEDKLTGIVGAHFDVIYLISQKLVKKSNDDGYLVGSRGSVGSSLVATMMGITEVNALSPHYVCPNCKHSIFEIDGRSLGSDYGSGYDLPDKKCPKCDELMNKEGQDMPFATFLGFHADKVPDIDLNFSDLNQAAAHEYTKVLFGVDNVYRAGTIGTVAEKTAFGYVKGYCNDKGIQMRTAEVERLAKGCEGVKRTTGQHPGGIVVIPGYMDVFDFTPFQYPADDVNSAWRTTHFDYHAIDQDVLKLDILGHSGPTKLRLVQDITGDDVTKIPLDDKETMGIFLSPEPLGVTKDQIMCETGSLGIPEFGTPFTLQLVKETKPKSFAELVKISGLSHGTDVWNGNAKDLIDNGVVPFSDVIGCRDDIMVYLMYHGLKPIDAFKIMEFVRKGRASKQPDMWKDYVKIMEDADIEPWFINSCAKIKYMFPKAHAVAYVVNAFRLAYYKVHKPEVYYAAQFSVEYDDFDIEAMIKGYESVKARIIEINEKGYDATNKESSILECLKLALEALARGYTFKPINLYKSHYSNFVIDDDNKSLIPPFRAIDGLGMTVAKNIVDEREKREFISIEDLQKRAKISSTLIEKLRSMGILDGMEESSQLSLF
ncbi:MAG: PolC-type DNA polymerase III [Bacilli bacterium]|nr:PolC-type DNA polymerase III [Bacilli bacterium]